MYVCFYSRWPEWKDGSGGRVRWAYDCDYDISNMNVKNEPRPSTDEQCRDMCADTPWCRKFTWTDWEGGKCFLKSDGVITRNIFGEHKAPAVCGEKK